MNKQKIVYFLHLPKAAGSTLREVLLRQYSGAFCLAGSGGPHIWDTRLSELSSDEKQRLQLVAGHIRHGQHDLINRKHTYISMMRNPVKRIISQFYYIKRHNGHTLHNWVCNNEFDLSGYVDAIPESKWWMIMENRQARRLAGLKPHRKEQANELVDRAKENIEKDFTLVGTTERFDESLLLTKSLLGWERHVFYRKRNVSKKKGKAKGIPEKTLSKIKSLTKADRVLYKWVNERLTQKIKNSNVLSDIKIYNKKNKLYNVYRVAKSKLSKIYRSLTTQN